MDIEYDDGKMGGGREADVGVGAAPLAFTANTPDATAAALADELLLAPLTTAGEILPPVVPAPAAASTMIRPLLCDDADAVAGATAVVVLPLAAAAADIVMLAAFEGKLVLGKSPLRGTVGLGAVTATGAGVVANTTEPPSEPWRTGEDETNQS